MGRAWILGKLGVSTDYSEDLMTEHTAVHAPSNAEANDPNTTLEGNTFNGVEQLVKTNASGDIQAIIDLNLGDYQSRGYWKGTQAQYDLEVIDLNTDYDIIEL